MHQLALELEQNTNISEERFRKILKRYGYLGYLLNQYGRMIWKIKRNANTRLAKKPKFLYTINVYL